MLGLVNLVMVAAFTQPAVGRRYTVQRGRGICELPVVAGNCARSFPRYYFDQSIGECLRFIYTGCGGNGNRFVSKQHCTQRCVPDWSPTSKIVATLHDPAIITLNNTVCSGCHEKNGVCLDGKCQCRTGFEMIDNMCQDRNECEWEKCPSDAMCVNSPGSFRCECPVGFAGSGLNCTRDPNICAQPFDVRYEEKYDGKSRQNLEIKYFFDRTDGVCKQFWYGGRQFAQSANFFNDIQTCQVMCDLYSKHVTTPSSSTTTELRRSTTDMPLPDICLDAFDETRRRPCKTGDWKMRYYYDNTAKRCKMFWWDESCGLQHMGSRNVFILMSTCKRACEGVNPDSEAFETELAPYEYKVYTDSTAQYSSTTSAPTPDTPPPDQPFPTYFVRPDSTLRSGHVKAVGVIQAHFTFITTTTSPLDVEDLLADGVGPPLDDGLEDAFGDFGMVERKKVLLSTAATSVSIARDCLEPFDKNLTRSCSHGNRPWQPKYYYDLKTKSCMMYWNDGCMSLAKNNFDNLRTCQWMCEGQTKRPEAEHCLDEFDPAYMDNCGSHKYQIRYYFNHQRKECELFYYGGCRSKSRNIFEDYRDCEDLCATANRLSGDICSQPFDQSYRDSCARNGSYAQYYYYDQITESCAMFWYGNCKGKSNNIFARLETCQWLCEKRKEEKVPAHCMDRFDENYRRPCNNGVWVQRWYFHHKTGRCQHFWYDGCVGTSQNIFVEESTCKNLCEKPALPFEGSESAIAEEIHKEKEAERCLEPVTYGKCHNKLPAFYYNTLHQRCEPFIYSGCGGNGNRFLTLKQCDRVCAKFRNVPASESACFHVLNAGFGRRNKTCVRKAGFRFYYNAQYQRCGRFWYFGCGGNPNSFKTHEHCERICLTSSERIRTTKPVSACFRPINYGHCEQTQSAFRIKKWAFDAAANKCATFEFRGCNGTDADNSFDRREECEQLCQWLRPPKSEQCQYQPDWGPCNMLRQQWFYNLTTGTCAQFLYGGCGGNPNRFGSFEQCQRTCEASAQPPPPRKDPCAEKLDRGKWCEAMSNRYYYHQRSGACRGFHYTGCGKSNNNFVELEECERVCVKKEKKPQTLIALDVDTNGTSYVHVKPSEEPNPEQHVILRESAKRYLKTSGHWIDYGHCVGFRYNVSGSYTKLNAYLCLMEEGGECDVQTHRNTHGEEHCKVLRPWMLGTHMYTWFFTVERRPWKWTPSTRRRQSARETAATLIVLPVNDCHSVC